MKIQGLVQSLERIFYEWSSDWLEANYSDALKKKSCLTVFTDAITVWLMVVQKTLRDNTLVGAVSRLRDMGGSEVGRWLKASRSFARGEISGHGGGLAQARARLPLPMVEGLCDELSRRAEEEHREDSKLHGYQVYILDGSTIGLENTAAIKEEAVPLSNDRGAQRPPARVTTAHHAVTAIARRPEIGSIKESEQKQAGCIMKRIPKGSVSIGDRNFGVFSVAYDAQSHELFSLVRLKEERAQRILGKQSINCDGEYQVT
jgi:hypothetical protein